VVHRFPIFLAQVASIHNDNLSLLDIVHCKNLA
jgi:hypothetical protein